MKRTLRIYGIVLALFLALIGFLELSRKTVVDWRKTFDAESKAPFGLFVFDKEAEKIFGGKLKKSVQSPYTYFANKNQRPQNILFINKFLDETSLERLLKEVEKGSDLFIAGTPDLSGMGVHTSRYFSDDDVYLHLLHRNLNGIQKLDKFPDRLYISRVPKNAKILGYTKVASNSYPNFIQIPKGKGSIYIHTEPLFLTNYQLLKPGEERYAAQVLSYLPDRETVWFQDFSTQGNLNAMYFVLSNPPLKFAWWTFLVTMLLFMIFNAKRRQRIVPVINPPENKSAEFVKSIGNLYLQEGDFRDMMAKKATYFLHFVRTEFLIDTERLDEEFIQKLISKSGQPEEKIREAVALIQKSLHQSHDATMQDLEKMNRLLDEISK